MTRERLHPDDPLLYVAHPTVHMDALAAPWIHAAGTVGGLAQLGKDVVLIRFPVLERMFARKSSRPVSFFAKIAAHAAVPVAVLAVAFHRRGLLYVRHYHDLALAYPILRVFRRRVVVEVNATLAEEPHALAAMPAAVRRFASAAEVALLRTAPFVVAVSDVLRGRLVARGVSPLRTFTVHNAFDPDELTPSGTRGAGDGIVYVGNFKPWHRVDLLIESYGRVCRETPHDLYLVGAGDTSTHRAMAEEIGIAERVHFLGSRGRSDVVHLMREAAILVLPHTEDYGSPLKMFEYMSSGRPVLLPDLPNIREVAADTVHALLFKPGDRDSLAGAMRVLLQDTRLASAMADRAERLVRDEYTWRRSAERILEGIAARSGGTSSRSGAERA